MYAKLKSPIFIDSVVFEFAERPNQPIKAVLKDEEGSVRGRLHTMVPTGAKSYVWDGLNDLPYGIYTLEYSEGVEEHRQRLVKRI